MKKLLLLVTASLMFTSAIADDDDSWRSPVYVLEDGYQSGWCFQAGFMVKDGQNICVSVDLDTRTRLQTRAERYMPKEIIREIRLMTRNAKVRCPGGLEWEALQDSGCARVKNY